MDNLSTLCNASGCWLTYDNHEGKWSVIINQAGASAWSFTDSNIIGAITISGTGLYNLYNSVKVSFPHEDLRNQKDYVQIDIPDADRYPNEPDNTLEIDYRVVTNPVQAQLLGFIELKQSRADKIITFNTDYSRINVKAGDIIDITNAVYGFTAKKFRVITVREVDGSDNSINIEITALEYDATVYDETTLSRYSVSNQDGIVSIGAIPTPTTPTVTSYDYTRNPRVSANTRVQGGLVEAVEFWYTTDVPPAINTESARTYRLLGTVRPTTGATYAVNEYVQLEVPSLSAGEFLIKARCINSEAASSFSSPSGKLTYTAKQMTDAVSDSTTTIDSNGIVKQVALASLLSLANDYFFNGNAAAGPGGGTGSGSTFLLLTLQNFNSNATTGSSSNGYGSIFVPVVRVVPPSVPSTIEGINQTSLSQCIVGDGRGQDIVDIGQNPEYINHWPLYYPHKIVQRFAVTGGSQNVYGATDTQVYGIDLGVYRYYYPTATSFKLEIRGYWQLRDIQDLSGDYQYTDTSSTPVTTIANTVWRTTTVGSEPIRANAYVVTNGNVGTYVSADGSSAVPFFANYSALGIGTAGNTTVTASVYPKQLGSNVATNSIGQYITTFNYNFNQLVTNAPSFDNFGLFQSNPDTTISVPTAWSLTKSGNTINRVVPAGNITVSSVVRSIGNTKIYDSVTSLGGGNYRHSVGKVTEVGNVITGFQYPRVRALPVTANVFSKSYIENNQAAQIYSIADNTYGVTYSLGYQEWWNQIYQAPFTAGTGQLSSGQFANNQVKVTTTSVGICQINTPNKTISATREQYVPIFWGDLRSNVSGSHGSSLASYDSYGYALAGQYYNDSGVDQFPYVSIPIPYGFGLFTSTGNATVANTHIEITSNVNANVNADNGLGYWVTSTV
jgi:hypothetical protein